MKVDGSGWKWMKRSERRLMWFQGYESEWNGDESGWKWMKVDERGQYGIIVYDRMKMDESGYKWMKVDGNG